MGAVADGLMDHVTADMQMILFGIVLAAQWVARHIYRRVLKNRRMADDARLGNLFKQVARGGEVFAVGIISYQVVAIFVTSL
jgi:hypothetical protein